MGCGNLGAEEAGYAVPVQDRSTLDRGLDFGPRDKATL